jgi:RNA polymerase sigma factor (sigma-70 family)
MVVAEENSFVELMNRLRARDQDAATAVFRRYRDRLIALARARLDPGTRRKVDPEDVVQSAYRSFFVRYDAGRLDVASWDELWSLLTVITVRKCANQVTHYRAARRAVTRETSPDARDETWDVIVEAINRDPTASEAAILTETVEQLLRGLDTDDRAMIELSLQGYSVAEISERLPFSERTVGRMRERVRRRLIEMQTNESRAG